jgi:type IV secretion system protein VirB4
MKTTRWHQRAKPTSSIVPIRRFVNEHVFGLKNGGYGCMFGLDGIDEEGLTDDMVGENIKTVEGAFKNLPEHGRIYQYVRVRKGFELPRQAGYSNARVSEAISERNRFLERTADFRRIELFWAVTVEPDNKNSFASKTLSPEQYARQTVKLIAQTERTAETLLAQLSEPLGVRLLGQNDVASFFAYLLNLEPWALGITLSSPERVDQQIVRSSLEWHHEHLRVGKQHVQMFSLLDAPAGSRPNLFGALQSINANAIYCSMWSPRSRDEVQNRISQIEGFSGIFRHRVLALAANLRNPENLERSVGAKAAEKGMDSKRKSNPIYRDTWKA